MKKKMLMPLLISMVLVSCNEKPTSLNAHIVPGDYFENEGYVSPMNTIVSLRMYYESQLKEVSAGFDKIVKDTSKEMDRYHLYENINNLKTINDSCGSDEEVVISTDLFDVIRLGLDITKYSQGAFNIAMGNLIDLYAPKYEEYDIKYNTLPTKEDIDEALLSIPSYEEIEDYIVLNEENSSVTLKKYNGRNIVISLGGIAKGYVMDKAYEYLHGFNYPCIYDAGSSTMGLIGSNPLKKKGHYNVSFKNPSLNISDSEVEYDMSLLTVSLKDDMFISTSGDYQQSFFYLDENNNTKLAHHILDSSTGLSNNYYRSVSLFTDKYTAGKHLIARSNRHALAILDACSTAIFNIEDADTVPGFLERIKFAYDMEISYILTKPYENKLDEFEIVISKDVDDILVYESNQIKNKTVK